MLLLDRQAWLHSAKCFLAAICALYIALAVNLPRPYWAMTTAYVVMQPVLGGTNARGGYRIAGTLLAVVAVLVIVPNLLQAPLLLSLAMSLWLSGCLFVALLHRGPASYVFMLAGYTAAFVGFPAVLQPDAIFPTAIARAEEIVLGSLCAVIVGAVVFPASIKPMVRQRVQTLMQDARAWCTQVLERRGSPAGTRRRMAADLAQIDQIVPFAGRDDPRHGRLDEWILELRARMLGMLPVLASIEDRLEQLTAGSVEHASVHELLARLRQWVGDDAIPDAESLAAFRRHLSALRASPDDERETLLLDTLIVRLDELATLWYDSRHLQEAIAQGKPPPAPAFGLDLRSLVRASNRHVDWSMLTFSALAAGVTLFAYCLLWIAVGWPDGAYGAMMAAVAAAFFAGQDDPAPNIVRLLAWSVVAMLLSGVFLFGIVPLVHDFVPLVLVIMPAFLLIGLLASRPSLFLPGMVLVTNLCALLSIQNQYAADFTVFMNSSISTVLGVMFAVVSTRLFRSVGAEWTARRLVRQGWKLLADAAEGRGQQDRERFMMRMLDLLGLLAPRLAALPPGHDIAVVDMLHEVRMGLNILNLRRSRASLPRENAARLDDMLRLIGSHYRAQQRAGRPLAAPDALKQRLDGSLERLSTLRASDGRDQALVGLVGLRYGLFPRAAT